MHAFARGRGADLPGPRLYRLRRMQLTAIGTTDPPARRMATPGLTRAGLRNYGEGVDRGDLTVCTRTEWDHGKWVLVASWISSWSGLEVQNLSSGINTLILAPAMDLERDSSMCGDGCEANG